MVVGTNVQAKDEKLKIKIITKQHVNFASSMQIAADEGGRLLTAEDIDNLTPSALNELRKIVRSNSMFYLGNSMLPLRSVQKLARKIKDVLGCNVSFSPYSGSNFYIWSNSHKSVRLDSCTGSMKANTVVIVLEPGAIRQTGNLSPVTLDSMDDGRYCIKLSRQEMSNKASQNNRSPAGTLQVLMSQKFIESNSKFAIVVDSRDVRDVFPTSGYYIIDRKNHSIKKMDQRTATPSYEWHELVHVYDTTISAIKDGKPIVIVPYNSKFGSQKLTLSRTIPAAYGAVLAVTSAMSIDQKLVEMRRSELIAEAEDAKEEKAELIRQWQ